MYDIFLLVVQLFLVLEFLLNDFLFIVLGDCDVLLQMLFEFEEFVVEEFGKIFLGR